MKCEYCKRNLPNESLKLRNGCKWCGVKYQRSKTSKRLNRQKPKYIFREIVGIINNYHVDTDESIAIERIKKVLRGESNA